MVNGEIGGGLYKAYVWYNRTISGSTVALQWLYSGSTTNKRRTKDEGMTNKRRTYDEGKANLR